MELFKKASILSALLLAAASTASAFVPRVNKLSNTCGASTFDSVAPSHMKGGLFMSAVADADTDTDTGAQVLENIRLVTVDRCGVSASLLFALISLRSQISR